MKRVPVSTFRRLVFAADLGIRFLPCKHSVTSGVIGARLHQRASHVEHVAAPISRLGLGADLMRQRQFSSIVREIRRLGRPITEGTSHTACRDIVLHAGQNPGQ